jgi:hypothetical protein
MNKQSSFQAKPSAAALTKSSVNLLEPRHTLGRLWAGPEAAGVETDGRMSSQGQFASPSPGWKLCSVSAHGDPEGPASGEAAGQPADRGTVTHVEHNRQRLAAPILRARGWTGREG